LKQSTFRKEGILIKWEFCYKGDSGKERISV